MNTNVDVLAVLDREIAAHLLGPSEHAVGCEELPPGHRSTCTCNGPELLATRAAVAELIEAANVGPDQLDPHTQAPVMVPYAEIMRLRAALARVGGAA